MVAILNFRLGVADLSATSFACSPLAEAVFSLRTLVRPVDRYPWHRPWLQRMLPALASVDTEILRALMTPSGYCPDFLTPRPTSPWMDFQKELAVVRATPLGIVRRDIEAAYLSADLPLPPVLREMDRDPASVLRRTAEAFQQYWTYCLEPFWWPRARSVLTGDIVYRARMLAERGADGLFADLDPRVSWSEGVLSVRQDGLAPGFYDDFSGGVDVNGRGLVLVPSLFVKGAITDIFPDVPPKVTYPARGRADMAEGTLPQGPPALRRLLGAPRARVLVLLDQPTSTTEVARRLGVTPGAASQHLSVLLEAGLVIRARHGRNVLYHRSPLGNELCRPHG